jgi:hypothetical protein
MTAGDPIATGLADRYRRALADGVPEAEDDRRYGFGLAAACISWAIVHLHRFASLDNRAPGDGSRLQLVETLEAAAHTSDIHRALPHLAASVRRSAGQLHRRWSDADLDFTDPAAFRRTRRDVDRLTHTQRAAALSIQATTALTVASSSRCAMLCTAELSPGSGGTPAEMSAAWSSTQRASVADRAWDTLGAAAGGARK